MPYSPLDLERLLHCLNAEPELRYVLVGGLAVAAHGGTRLTEDIDIAVAYDAENRRHVVHALAPLRPRPSRSAPGAEWVWDELSIRAPWSVFDTDAGRIDLIVRLRGVDSFEGLFARSEVHGVMGHEIRVAAIEDLLAMKREANRDRDRDDINQLLALQNLNRSGDL
ncbi:MAG: hypothetical protein ACO1SV_11990 [Fimbriimonas sp.]